MDRMLRAAGTAALTASPLARIGSLRADSRSGTSRSRGPQPRAGRAQAPSTPGLRPLNAAVVKYDRAPQILSITGR